MWPSVDASPESLSVAQALVVGSSETPSLSSLNFSRHLNRVLKRGQTLYFAVVVLPPLGNAECAAVSAFNVGIHTAGDGFVSTLVDVPRTSVCSGQYFVTPYVVDQNVLSAGTASSSAGIAPAADTTGFYYGLDTSSVSPTGSGPYTVPFSNGVSDGTLGAYYGQVGDYQLVNGCSNGFFGFNQTTAKDAQANQLDYGAGMGTSVFFTLGGPGADPSWNSTSSEAYAWGARQANAAAKNFFTSPYYPYAEYATTNIMWLDIESGYGWDSGGSGCQAVTYTKNLGYNRDVFNGFWNCLQGESGSSTGGVTCTGGNNAGTLGDTPGVYSAPQFWNVQMSPNVLSSATWQWTFENSNDQNTTSYAPQGWSIAQPLACGSSGEDGTANTAKFFSADTTSSSGALAWQWAGGNGCNTSYTMDQVDVARY